MIVRKNFLVVNQRVVCFDEKFLKKVLAGWEKGGTFAPANDGRGARERGCLRKFFDSLRPAQKKQSGLREQAGRNPRFRRKIIEYNNTTTKSLILAQDERWRQA